MDYSAAGIFLTGLVLGTSQCTLTCGPALGLYVAGTADDWHDSLRATLADRRVRQGEARGRIS